MMSLWMAPDWGAGKIWGLQPRSALVASGRQQILHPFFFFNLFYYFILFFVCFLLFLFFPAIFCFSSRDPGSRCPCLLGAIFALPWELGIAARSCRSAWTEEKQHDTWQSRDWGRYYTEGPFPWSVQRGTRSPPCSTLTTLPEGPKMAAPPFSSLLLVATRRAEPRPPPLRFLRTTTPSMPRAAADVRLPPPALHYPAGLRGGYQSACFVLGGAREWGWLPRERAKRKRRGGSGAGDVSSRAAPPLPLPELGPREWQR